MDRDYDLPHSTIASEGTHQPYVENALFELKQLREAVNELLTGRESVELWRRVVDGFHEVDTNLRKAL